MILNDTKMTLNTTNGKAPAYFVMLPSSLEFPFCSTIARHSDKEFICFPILITYELENREKNPINRKL